MIHTQASSAPMSGTLFLGAGERTATPLAPYKGRTLPTAAARHRQGRRSSHGGGGALTGPPRRHAPLSERSHHRPHTPGEGLLRLTHARRHFPSREHARRRAP